MKIIDVKTTEPIKFRQFETRGETKYMLIYDSIEAMEAIFEKTKKQPDAYDLGSTNNEKYTGMFQFTGGERYPSDYYNAGVPPDKWITTEDFKNGETIKTFHSPELVPQVENIIRRNIVLPRLAQDKIKSLKANAIGRGVFSFDRAAQGMYRVYEFYSLKLEKIVDETEVEKIAENTFVLKADGSEVERRAAVLENGKPKVRTNSKKVWLNFEEKEQAKKSINIYIIVGVWGNQASNDMVYSGAYLSVLVQYFTEKNYEINIIAYEGTEIDAKIVFSGAYLKKKKEPIDYNKLIIVTSDIRFFRTIFFYTTYVGFKGIGQTKIPSGLGSPLIEFSRETKEEMKEHFDPEGKGLHFFINTITSLSQVQNIHRNVMNQVQQYEQATA